MKKRFAASIISALLVSLMVLSASAASALPDGFLIVDDTGMEVTPDTGTYYFQVTDMLPGETYTKQIQLQNLNANDSFKLFMQANPQNNEGDIDLFKEVTVTITLDGTVIFTGSPDGTGSVNMQTDSLDLGTYSAGQQRQMEVSMVMNSAVGSEEGHLGTYGNVDFQWIFTAQKDQKEETAPQTGEIVNTFLSLGIAMMCVGTIFLVVLVIRKKKENDKNGK